MLRQWRDEDREPWAALCADPEVMRHFPAPLSRGEADDFVDRHSALIDERGWGLWAAEVVDGAAFVGMIGLLDVGALMSSQLVTARVDEDVAPVVSRMRWANVRRVPVVDDAGSVMGVLSLDDVLPVLAR